ncbi:MAG: hypothetical protein GKR89_36745 [Candidatus Latescibacteria bacterium]|nr:hypothetical protein [Candidatus Latescibacterota bacterium]
MSQTQDSSQPIDPQAYARAQRLAAGLYPHQVEGIAFLLGRQRSILADDMGLGKTRQAALAMTQAREQGPYLVVCPAAVKRVWEAELALVLPQSETIIVGPGPVPQPGFTGWVIINYDILGKHLDLLTQFPWSGLIYDEAHYLKNFRSQRHRQARAIAEAADAETVVHLLTGTPLTSRPRDLFPLLQLARHTLGRNFVSFAKRYCQGYKGEYGWVADGASNIEELTVQLHGIMLRRTKDKVLDLPPKVRSWMEVEVSSSVARRMSQAVLQLLGTISRGGGAKAVLGETEKQRQRRQGTIMGQLTTARLRLATAKVRSTIPHVENIVEQGEKALVFSCFIRPIEKMAKYFGDKAVVIVGETPLPQRQEAVDRFQNDDSVRLLLANINAGGVGLNLTRARQVVFNDLDWVPVNHWQAEDRAYRIGQQFAVNVTYMVGLQTVDEFVRTVLETKAHLIDQLVEGQALAEDFQRDVLGELRHIMGLLGPRMDDVQAGKVDEEGVEDLLRQASATFKSAYAAADQGQAPAQPAPSQQAIATLARVLVGPAQARYRVASASQAGSYYELDVEGSDITCSCKGFSYRGVCQHARTLKEVLVKGAELPQGFERQID